MAAAASADRSLKSELNECGVRSAAVVAAMTKTTKWERDVITEAHSAEGACAE